MTLGSNEGWIKATASNDAGDCVEMRANKAHVQVRDSKLGSDSPVHTLTRADFSAWVSGAKAGEFDALSN
jgi:hypothetical protein